ncbi:RBP protein [Aspergillus avenaceus]|uniref:RBP protein n=1 Tax=Aspergillus avenaceus TaxID=36643 RepID=A0A5N6TVS1_ASPAV|nr:RBP protein [Aspergillus avenaceus]
MAAATVADLPRHNIAFEKPPKSEPITFSTGESGYAWELTPTERAHIAEMLNVDISEVTIDKNFMSHEREECRGCGKYMGLDDMVHNAQYGGVHGTAFMLDVLQNGNKNQSPAHVIYCSRCTTQFGIIPWWMESPTNWSK